MKKLLRKVMCIIAAAAVCSLCGCTVSKSGENKDGGVIKPKAESAKDGTVAYTYEYTDRKGEKKTEKVEIDVAEVDSMEFGGATNLKNEKFVSKLAPNYGMSESDAEKAVAKDSEFEEFQFMEYIENKSGKTMAFKKLSVEGNGKNSIWINTDLGAEYTIVPGAIYPVCVSGVVDMSKHDGDSVEEAFDEINVKLEYTLVDSAQDDIDWEKAEIQTMDIH